MAAEYILKEGNEQVMLCERGIRTFEPRYRFTLDLMAVPVLQASSRTCRSSSTRATRPGGATWWSRCRWRPPRPAPTASSWRSTRAPRRPSATARRRSYADDFADYLRKVEAAAELAGKQFTTVG